MPEIKTIPLHNAKTLVVVTGLPEGVRKFQISPAGWLVGFLTIKKLPFPCTLIGLLSNCGEEQAEELVQQAQLEATTLYKDYMLKDSLYHSPILALVSLLRSHGVTDQNPLLLLKN